ncbi:histidine phosphatase family protein [Enterobacter cloacae complex sp. Mu1197]|uniref:Histidine phosphatase family protein n=1 Tax=Enterobacter cloacae complex sp. Mu1197 TaxID=3152302 RepID=A0AAU7G2L3_9ENTR
MEIILMRHGEPEYRGAGKVSYREMAGWIDSYNRSSTGRDRPSEMAQILAYRALTFLSSPLPRALSSLKTLGCEPGLIDEVFREAELPVFRIPGLRLSPFYWAALFRVLWLCGLSGESECVSVAKERAVKAAEILVNVAKDSDGPVLLMGHGMINRFIAKELIASGWKEQTSPVTGYWGAGVYSLV